MIKFEAIVEDFVFLEDWEDRYKYIIELGKSLLTLSQEEHCEDTRIRGCASQVWLIFDEASADRISFRGNSDAHIVRGLVALMISLFSGKSAAEIQNLNAEAALGLLDLKDHISPQRSNGVIAMINKIKAIANKALI